MKWNLALKSLFVVVRGDNTCEAFDYPKYEVSVAITDMHGRREFPLYSGDDEDVVNQYIKVYNIKGATVSMFGKNDGCITAFQMWE